MRRAGAVTIVLLVGFVVPGWAQDVIFADNFEYGPDRGCMWWSMVEGSGRSCEMVISLAAGDAVTMTFMYIPPGTFWMGSPTDERGRGDWEDLHEVTLTWGYYVGKYEVTQEQWQVVMGTPPWVGCSSYGVGADYPVYCVSWDMIAGFGGFVQTLNAYLASTGQATGFRLPKEAEWERAARAGAQTAFSFDTSANPTWDTACGVFAEADVNMWWCGNNTPYRAKPVGSRQPNGYGLYDMHGNEYEWVQDWYTEHLGTSPVTDPTGPGTGSYRVVRGGSWVEYARFCRSAFRGAYDPFGPSDFIGFRLARTAY